MERNGMVQLDQSMMKKMPQCQLIGFNVLYHLDCRKFSDVIIWDIYGPNTQDWTCHQLFFPSSFPSPRKNASETLGISLCWIPWRTPVIRVQCQWFFIYAAANHQFIIAISHIPVFCFLINAFVINDGVDLSPNNHAAVHPIFGLHSTKHEPRSFEEITYFGLSIWHPVALPIWSTNIMVG